MGAVLPPSWDGEKFGNLDLVKTAMEGWNKLQASLNNINFSQAGTKITKGFTSSVQATRERLGAVSAEEITELPQGPFH